MIKNGLGIQTKTPGVKLFQIIILTFTLIISFPVSSSFGFDEPVLSDDEIRDIMIGESIARYPGTCPCPYNRARNGSRCGKRSAYSKPGGYSPLCYRSDISDSEVKKYRQKHKK